jgi:hypothetical protein
LKANEIESQNCRIAQNIIMFTIKMYLKNAVIFPLGTHGFVFVTDPTIAEDNYCIK